MVTSNVMIVPAGISSGIFPVSLGLAKALNDKGTKAVIFRPLSSCTCQECAGSVPTETVVKLLAAGRKADLVEQILGSYEALVAEKKPDVVIIEGVTNAMFFNQDEVNAAICHALDAKFLVTNLGFCNFAASINALTLSYFGNAAQTRFMGNIILNADAKLNPNLEKSIVLAGSNDCCPNGSSCSCSANNEEAPCFLDKVVGKIPYNPECYSLRSSDIARLTGGRLKGDGNVRVYGMTLCPKSAAEHDILITAEPCDTAAGLIILTGGREDEIAGKTVIYVNENRKDTLLNLGRIAPLPPCDDPIREKLCADYVAPLLCPKMTADINTGDENRIALMSPASFCYKLTNLARREKKRIALPEGSEPRTVAAAAKVAHQGIAVPVLYGKKELILKVAEDQGIELPDTIEFIDPDTIRDQYVSRLVELRKSKGLTPEEAKKLLEDDVFLATMMLEKGEVDGLVSGAIHTTANTIRPAFQVIKTAPGASLVSSALFMLMPEQVYVFADCAINPNPNANELADIAIQSSDTAKAFGIDPKVAMVTYSTGTSGKGPDIDLVAEAYRIAKEKRPDLIIDGPIQYDAAIMPDVAAQKAPGSPVAGQATVFIFPSLEVGNTVYKAVQRSANIISIGPMLQGMRKPVNDLSRGALVEDIVYTIAITAIQAQG